MHPRSKHGHMIDHIITRSCDLKDVCSVCVLHNAECNTGHKLVQGKFKLQVRRKVYMARIKIPRRMNAEKIKQPGVCLQLSDALDNPNFDGSWVNFKEQVRATVIDILGLNQKKKKTKKLV